MLFAAGFGKGISEAAKGWAILSLSLKGIRRERRGEGSGISLPTIDGRSSGKRLAKSTLLFAPFLLKKK